MVLGIYYIDIMQKIKKKAQVLILTQVGRTKKVLLLRTNKKRGQFWQNVTGSVEKKESFFEGALRELHEETGLNLDHIVKFQKLNLAFKFKDRFNKNVVEEAFLVVVNGIFTPKLDAKEHDKFQWKNASSIKQSTYKFGSNYRTLIEALECL
jgi:8-oxo-dGTP pyrophosphatase MutT (NUDIX family)